MGIDLLIEAGEVEDDDLGIARLRPRGVIPAQSAMVVSARRPAAAGQTLAGAAAREQQVEPLLSTLFTEAPIARARTHHRPRQQRYKAATRRRWLQQR